MRSAEIAQRREEQEQCRKEQEMEQVARLQHEEDERREAEKARKALAAQRREERKVARQVRLLSHKCGSNNHVVACLGSTLSWEIWSGTSRQISWA